MSDTLLAPVLFLPHGGGPLPLLGEPSHKPFVDWLSTLAPNLPRPKAILVISAHWETPVPSVTASEDPGIVHDYYGFPEAAYKIEYPVKGSPALSRTVIALLKQQGMLAVQDELRPLDHGVFVPLTLLYPNADIPCVQLSLLDHLNPETHIELGEALRELRKKGVLIIGSGLSFHNLKVFFDRQADGARGEQFDQWLTDTCCAPNHSYAARCERLINWETAPEARYCHPREEHLLPLHVCLGAGGDAPAEHVFSDYMLRQKVSGYLWR
ncbi:DODA-type extradiol aromatic ring-opening family dioxygenase [Neptunomonas marina]|uniref:Dioxygenase n=1 Tax=Neptunomonas marina TaxID=1815562 RepID=A0A437Q519_9GAMM|nr:class III extradiol ring-cleavage dioxygenase [Neptunomonas marina]RVU29591.1 dioxygenase [Neptunomonas marina]